MLYGYLLGGIAILGLITGLLWYRGEAIDAKAAEREAKAANAALTASWEREKKLHDEDRQQLAILENKNQGLAKQVSATRTAIARLPKEKGNAPDCVVREAPIAAALVADIDRLLYQPASIDGAAPEAGTDRARPASGTSTRAGAVENGPDRGPVILRPGGRGLPGDAAQSSRGRTLR